MNEFSYMVITLRLGVVHLSEKITAIFASYNINRLVWYNPGGECLLRGTAESLYRVQQKNMTIFKLE